MKAKDESGVLLVEAAFYFPIIFILTMFFICVGMLRLQRAILEANLEKIEDEIAEATLRHSYDQTGEGVAVGDLYYRWDKSNWCDIEYYKQKVSNAIKQYSIIDIGFTPTPYVSLCKNTSGHVFLSYYYPYNGPRFFWELMGKDSTKYTYRFMKTTFINDAPEMIRNVDMIRNLKELYENRNVDSNDFYNHMWRLKNEAI